MARRRVGRAERDVFTIARPRLSPLIDYVFSPLDLSVFEDRRSFDPLRSYRPLGVFEDRRAREVVERPSGRSFFGPSRFHFSDPGKVVMCVRRHQRREVLFAKRKTRAGSGGRKRRNYWSDVSCR